MHVLLANLDYEEAVLGVHLIGMWKSWREKQGNLCSHVAEPQFCQVAISFDLWYTIMNQ